MGNRLFVAYLRSTARLTSSHIISSTSGSTLKKTEFEFWVCAKSESYRTLRTLNDSQIITCDIPGRNATLHIDKLNQRLTQSLPIYNKAWESFAHFSTVLMLLCVLKIRAFRALPRHCSNARNLSYEENHWRSPQFLGDSFSQQSNAGSSMLYSSSLLFVQRKSKVPEHWALCNQLTCTTSSALGCELLALAAGAGSLKPCKSSL